MGSGCLRGVSGKIKINRYKHMFKVQKTNWKDSGFRHSDNNMSPGLVCIIINLRGFQGVLIEFHGRFGL